MLGITLHKLTSYMSCMFIRCNEVLYKEYSDVIANAYNVKCNNTGLNKEILDLSKRYNLTYKELCAYILDKI